MTADQIEVAAFTGGRTVPSARFRVRQYVRALEVLGVNVEEMPSRFGKYPPLNRLIRPFWLTGALCEQAVNVGKLRKFDVVLLQREIISKLVTFERWIDSPTVLDVDDAIFLFRGGYVARRLAGCASAVVCGNTYLAEWFSKWSRNVRIIPTAVDTERYRPAGKWRAGPEVIVGWIGTSGNLFELVAIEAALQSVLTRFPNAKLRVVCDRAPHFRLLNPEQVEYIAWTEETEVACIQGMDIGIMPLRDSPWARGKCSFKLLQYMACGLPSVVSAVGMNVEVAQIRGCSRAVRSADEWVEALTDLVQDSEQRRLLGDIARSVAVDAFSVNVLAPQLARVVREAGAATTRI